MTAHRTFKHEFSQRNHAARREKHFRSRKDAFFRTVRLVLRIKPFCKRHLHSAHALKLFLVRSYSRRAGKNYIKSTYTRIKQTVAVTKRSSISSIALKKKFYHRPYIYVFLFFSDVNFTVTCMYRLP